MKKLYRCKNSKCKNWAELYMYENRNTLTWEIFYKCPKCWLTQNKNSLYTKNK